VKNIAGKSSVAQTGPEKIHVGGKATVGFSNLILSKGASGNLNKKRKTISS